MRLDTFELERIQSLWEHHVEINLSESGIEPLNLTDLVELDSLGTMRLEYVQTNGSVPLRRNIASLYRGATEEQVLVTNGGSEANLVAILNLSHEDPERRQIVVGLPNYMQIWGVAGLLGLRREGFWLKRTDGRWAPDLEALKECVSDRTLAIAVCTPNNPTGAVLRADELRAIGEIAEDCGAWVISDEIYRGTELDGRDSPSMWDYCENAIVTGGLSKAYAAPGLRIGWIVSRSARKTHEMWAYTDYTSITPSVFGDRLGTIILDPEVRVRVLARSRRILNENWSVVSDWLDQHGSMFDCVAPEATGICIVRYDRAISSTVLADRLIGEKSVLVAPGDHFLMPQHFRLGYGHDPADLAEGLRRITELLDMP